MYYLLRRLLKKKLIYHDSLIMFVLLDYISPTMYETLVH